MVAAPIFLVAETGIEGLAFVDQGIAVPDAITPAKPGPGIRIPPGGMGLGEGIGRIKDGHAIHGHANVAQMLEFDRGFRHRMARQA